MTTAPGFDVRLADWVRDGKPLRSVRHAVFIVEQRVPECLEWDDFDARSQHAIAVDSLGNAIGCARLLPDGHIGRVAVLARWRKRGVGARLVARLIEVARERECAEVLLNAQTHALAFYARFGFEPYGAVFDEAGIPHQAMRMTLMPSPSRR